MTLTGLNIRVPRLGKNRHGVYYLRLTVTAADGKRKVVQKSLQTKDPLSAKAVALRFNLELIGGAQVDLKSFVQPYFMDASALRTQSKDEADDARRKEAYIRGNQVRDKLTPEQLASIQASMASALPTGEEFDYEIDLVARRYYARNEAAHRRLMQALDEMEAMATGFVPIAPSLISHVPPAPATVHNTSTSSRVQPSAPPSKLLKEAFEEHIADERLGKLDPQTVREKRNVFDDFLAAFGEDITFDGVSRSTINGRWKRVELTRKSRKNPSEILSPGRIDKRFRFLSKFFDWAVDQGYIPSDVNPCGKSPVSKRGIQSERQSYKPFTSDELAKLFSAEYLKFGTKPNWYWKPLIALYCGARLGEVSRLELDGFEEREGIKLFTIKVAKNPQSRRVVPIHSVLLKLGLWDYVMYLRSQKATRLFPHVPQGRNATKSIGRMWGLWVAECGITDPRKTFHSFRTTVITNLQTSLEHVNPVGVRDTVGHTSAAIAGSHGGYIIGHQLVMLQKTVEQLVHPSVNSDALRLEDPSFKAFFAKEGVFGPSTTQQAAKQASREKHAAARADRLARVAKRRRRSPKA